MTTDKTAQPQKLSSRDDFSATTKRVLRERVGGICSNPECRAPTFGPKGADQAFHTGHAAHICAAAPGGPRYDEHMTREERRGLNNGLWLCSGCSQKIDGDFQSYPTKLLKEWKAEAEAEAKKAQGHRPATHDAKYLLQQALAIQSKKPLASSISEAIHSETQVLKSLDTRFDVIPSLQRGLMSFELVPKETINTSWQFKPGAKSHYKTGLISLIENGEELEFELKDADIQGSPLLEKIFSEEEGRVVIKPKTLSATAQIFVRHRELDITDVLAVVEGTLVHGTKTATFNGAALGGCLNLSIPINLEGHEKSCAFIIGASVESWEGKRLEELPYLAQLLRLYHKLVSMPELHIVIEIDGRKLWEAAFKSQEHVQHIRQTYNLLKVTAAARQISIAFNSPVRWCSSKLNEMSHVQEIFETQSVLNGNVGADSSLLFDKLIFTTSDSESLRMLRGLPEDKVMSFSYIDPLKKVLLLFGVPVFLPKRQLRVTGAFMSFKFGRRSKSGECKVEWGFKPAEDFSMHMQYMS